MKTILLFLALGAMLVDHARPEVIVDDSFNYPDGPLVGVSAGTWTNHSGTLGEVDVTSGKVNLDQRESEDVHVDLAGGPYEGLVLYASFLVNFSALPIGAGTYFAHFKGATATGIRCRLFATTNGAASGRFRLGLANGAGIPVNVVTDLELNTDYFLVLRYDTGTPASTLWIHPDSESATLDRAEATDPATALAITSFALRQAGLNPGMGVLTLDELRVGTTFADVVHSGYRLDVQWATDGLEISWPVAAADYQLQGNETFDPAGWANVVELPAQQGDRLVVRYGDLSGRRFFRLIKP